MGEPGGIAPCKGRYLSLACGNPPLCQTTTPMLHVLFLCLLIPSMSFFQVPNINAKILSIVLGNQSLLFSFLIKYCRYRSCKWVCFPYAVHMNLSFSSENVVILWEKKCYLLGLCVQKKMLYLVVQNLVDSSVFCSEWSMSLRLLAL